MPYGARRSNEAIVPPPTSIFDSRFSRYSGTNVLGGPFSVYHSERHQFAWDEIQLIRLASAFGKRTLGSCLGSKLPAAARLLRVPFLAGGELSRPPLHCVRRTRSLHSLAPESDMTLLDNVIVITRAPAKLRTGPSPEIWVGTILWKGRTESQGRQPVCNG